MQALAQTIANSETAIMIYIGVLLATMILPMIYLSSWYHKEVAKTEGGNELMDDQNSAEYRARRGATLTDEGALRQAKGNFQKADKLNSEIMSGKYGSHAKQVQIQTYKFVGVWLLALGALGGLPFLIGWIANG